MIRGKGRDIVFRKDLSDWWVRLNQDGVVRTWGDSVRILDGMVVFGGWALPPDDFVELTAIPMTAVSRVVKGEGLNGEPRDSTPPAIPEGDEDWSQHPVGVELSAFG